ncbi:MAG: hypothetical protein LQ343_007136 [Gyalolechia ehrenbergii]|nr:MAG: hypothetical protein LQ343_007136 [Gyalolechia ehrenbergii]
MLLTTCTALALVVGFAHAFTDTSPLFLFSTSELLTTSPQIVHAGTISKTIISQLSKCPSDTYIVVRQPGVRAEDYEDRYAAPHLRKKIHGEDDRIRSSMSVTDVLGDVNTAPIITAIERNCGAALSKIDAATGSFAIADDPNPRVIELEFPTLPTGNKRASKLQENGTISPLPYPLPYFLLPPLQTVPTNQYKNLDAFLSSLLDFLPTSKFTVIYTTTSSSPPTHPSSSTSKPATEPVIYEMDTSFSSQTHMGSKRDFSASEKRADGGNVTLPDVPLFEKYAYLSPGIFMALLVIIPLFLILYVGVTGVASLQVSYAAFDREMGPAAAPKKG